MNLKSYYQPVKVKNEKIPMALHNAERQYDIVKSAYNGETYESIGSRWGITRQRVEAIIKRLYITGDSIKSLNMEGR